MLKRTAKRSFYWWVARKPGRMFAVQEAWLRLGSRWLDLNRAGWAIGRPEWLMQKSKPEPTPLAPSAPPDRERDLAIARRMIGTRPPGEREGIEIPEETIWGSLLLVKFDRLRTLVQGGDEDGLADLLGGIFRTETVDGFHYGTQLNDLPHQLEYLPVNIELSVVSLAECLGILRAEQHEQGEIAYWRRDFSEEELMHRLESRFGFRIEAPRAGNPRGIVFGGRFLTRETCSHLYSAYRMSQAIDRHVDDDALRIVEIGGGYGGTAYWLRKILGNRIERYAIVDLPDVALLQAYFLAYTDAQGVRLYGEDAVGDRAIELLPHFRLAEIDFTPNVVINQDSMPEMPETEVGRYLQWIVDNAEQLFLSFNQEAYSPWEGVPQIHVPTMAARYDRLRRVARETSWSRRGYVEEVYRLDPVPVDPN